MTIEVNETEKCPHCRVVNRFESVRNSNYRDISCEYVETKKLKSYTLNMCRCTNCGEIIIFLDDAMVYPSGTKRPPCPGEVPVNITEDYKEACLVEPHSKKAAAALARRCLQHILHDQGIKKII